MSQHHQVPRWFRTANRILTPFIRSRLPMGTRRAPMAILTVPGRKTGIPRSTPVALASRGDGWLLISVNGITDWARNLRSAGKATITMRGQDLEVTARELPSHEAAPLLRNSMAEAPALVRNLTADHFTATSGSPIEAWQRDASTHPVFVLKPKP